MKRIIICALCLLCGCIRDTSNDKTVYPMHLVSESSGNRAYLLTDNDRAYIVVIEVNGDCTAFKRTKQE